MTEVISSHGLEQTSRIAREILGRFSNRRIFAFSGDLGAGKTTLIQQLCRELGVTDFPVSPSFSIVNEYRNTAGDPVYHFDFYRINDIREAYDLGYEEYFFSGSYCFIEWPEKITELLPDECVYIRIEEAEEPGKRNYFFESA